MLLLIHKFFARKLGIIWYHDGIATGVIKKKYNKMNNFFHFNIKMFAV